MTPIPNEILLEQAEVTERRVVHMDDAADFGVELQRSEGLDLRACAGQLPSTTGESK